MKKLTIGMAVYEDFDGLYFSIQALRYYHQDADFNRIEFLVIDNCPTGVHSKSIKQYVSTIRNARYIGTDEIKGTAVRDLIFREAKTDYVLCMDSHVLLEPGALNRLLKYYDDNPETKNLLQGPMVADDIKVMTTHMKPEWRAGMFGIWDSDNRARDKNGEPFEIPCMGLGLFTCRKEAWLGFNKNFRGFGGEEFYIHEKFRLAGHKTLCLPFLRWIHRFIRPLGTIYRNKWEDRIRNYLIGWDEIGRDTNDVINYFSELVNPGVVKSVVENLNAENILKKQIEVKKENPLLRLYIFGAPGSGASTLSDKLSKVTKIPRFDCEHFTWKVTNPPYSQKFTSSEIQTAMMEAIRPHKNWIISGSMENWRDPIVPLISKVIFLNVPGDVRLKRLEERERKRWGKEISEGGSRHQKHIEFMNWNKSYETQCSPAYGLESHKEWLQTLKCPVLNIEGDLSEDEVVKKVLSFISHK